MFVCIAGHVLKKIPTADAACGLTSVDDELFVLFCRHDNQVAVYDMYDYKLLRHLNVPEVKGQKIIFNDMTSCGRRKRVYVSNSDSRCIHIFELSNSALSKWSVPYPPCDLSLTPRGNLLVTCCGQTNRLVDLSADSGQCVRDIELQSDIKLPQHAVQLTTGHCPTDHWLMSI